MKTYWAIPGPAKAPQQPCIAFSKYDGNNIRIEWSKKRGWYKYGTRKRLLDESNERFGCAIPIFQETLADDIEKVIKTNKLFRGAQGVIVFCELWGPSSFCGVHDPDEKLKLTPIDVGIHKKGIMLPRDFVKTFGHLDIADVIYEGNFNRQFVEDVRNGEYPVEEGVVAKGVIQGKKKNPQHGLWMAKVKTHKWFEKLRACAAKDDTFKKALEENIREQGEIGSMEPMGI